MKKLGLLLGAMLSLGAVPMSAQMENSIKLNEVMTCNTSSIQDEYGQHEAWIEITNISFSTYNIRGMFLTTDRSVLDKKMSVPERISRMSIIPNGEKRTSMGGQQSIVFFCNSNPAKGSMHLTVKIDPTKPTWIALYNGNAVNLIDSVTVPPLAANESFARLKDGSNYIWKRIETKNVTPGIANNINVRENKIAQIKREDPHGYGIAVLSMGIVFFCLALLFVFFTVFGMIMRHRTMVKKVAGIQPLRAGVDMAKKTAEIGHMTNVILQDGLSTKGIDKELYIAVISMALKQYMEDVHDVESGVITIKPKNTDWNVEYIQMTQFHE